MPRMKNRILFWIDRGVRAQLWVAGVATALTVYCLLSERTGELALTAAEFPLVVVLTFFTFLTGYRYTKFQGSTVELRTKKWTRCSALLAVLAFILLANWEILGKGIVIMSLGILYNSTFLPRTIRQIPWVKSFFVGAVWALWNVWLFSATVNLEWMVSVGCMVSALVIPFDIRDMEADDVPTLPNTLGIRPAKWVAMGLVGIAMGAAHCYLTQAAYWAWQLSGLAIMGSIRLTNKQRSARFYTLFLEGLLALPLLLILLLKAIFY